MVETIFGQASALLGRILVSAYSTSGVHALLLFCVFGGVGVLLDLDHVLSHMLEVSRPLHIPVCVLMWIICIAYGTFVVGRA